MFENAGMVVQEVDTANDIGKDLYVDLAQDGRFTGELIALQVKGGGSYRGPHGSHRLRADADDRDLQANGSVPVFGVIHDPDYDALYWTNLTSWSRSHLEEPGGAAATMSNWSLTLRVATSTSWARRASSSLPQGLRRSWAWPMTTRSSRSARCTTRSRLAGETHDRCC